MKITLCGSIAFIDELLGLKEQLEKLGHEIKMPPLEIVNEDGKTIPVKEYYRVRKSADENALWVWNKKMELMKDHFNKIIWSDAVLVLNKEKNNIPNYIGANTLMEMGLALYAGKKIFLLNPIPDMSYKEELFGMQPVVINGDLNQIN
ncbi:MAG: hypothetical protein ACD_76C00123G0002 [uncultured bacterium]|nr:MAG: hypothetical protein ACD_76C00123G0002 [uncultured bacterium]HBD05154.1 hypothetical protein [Candidatus Uhrbacteria bacterium]